MATIRKRNDRWQVQVRRQGFAPVARSFRLRTDAQEWAREMERQADRQELSISRHTLQQITLGELVTRYRDTVTSKKKIEQPVVWKFPDGVIMHPDIPI
jgi:hypothetical protein